MSFLIIMVLLLVVMYVLMIRPQRQRQMAQQRMVESAVVGDDILTTGGIYGTITEAEGDDVVVEIADGVTVHMTRRGIAAVLPPEEEGELFPDEETIEAEALEEPVEADEEAVTHGEEAVRDADAAPAGEPERS